MPYGLKDIELAKLNEVFAANERIERVILYGSRAKGNYKPFSDVDIALEGAELTHNDLSRLSLAIDDLLLPYQFDISIFHTLKNEALIDHIRRMGITIYEKKREWKEIKLGDCVEAIIDNRGKSAPTKQTGEYPLLEINSIGDYYPNYGVVRKYVDETTFKTWFRSGHPASGDILIPTVGTIGILSIMDNKKACIAQNIIALRINKDVSNVFIYYYLKSPIVKQELLNLDIGGVQPSIKVPHLLDLSISLPPKEVQVNIASVLSSFDDKIDLLHRENATLEQMAETLFRQWFVVEAKEEWEDVLLGNLIDIGSGKGLQRSDFVENGLYSVLGANGDIGKTNKYLVDESNRVIYTGRVGTLGNVFRLENKKAWLSDNTLVIKPKEYYNFVYFVLKLSRLQDYNVGSTQPLIRQSDIKEIELVLPDRGILNAFEKECDLIYEKVENNNKQIQTLIQMRDGLLPRLMGGEVKI